MAIDESSPPPALSIAPTVDSPKPAARRRWWLPAIVLVAYWAAVNAIAFGDFSDFQRFISRMSAFLAMSLFCLIWWFAGREFRWRDRFVVVIGTLLAGAVASQLLDKSVNLGVLTLVGLPWVFTIGVAWLALSFAFTTAQRRTGLLLIPLAVFGFLTLVRWHGVDGRQRNSYSWRWTPTPEEQFLASASSSSVVKPAEHARVLALQPGDWPYFRGEHESVIPGVTLASWQERPKAVWRKLVGPAWSSMIVVDGHLYTQEQRGETEAVACYDAATGEELWSHADKTRFSEGLSGDGPRGTPTFAAGRIYAYGATGTLNCLAAGTGEGIWSKEVLKDAGGAAPMWGLSVSPLLVDDLVVVFAGGKDGQGLVALKAATGEPAWSCEAGKESYCTPQVVTLGGARQLVMHDNKVLFAVKVEDGKKLWERPNVEEHVVPMLQPHVAGDNELLVAWDAGIALLGVTQQSGQWSVEEKWKSIALKPSFNDFVLHDGFIYGLDDGILCCVDFQTQRKKWKAGRYGHGQLLFLPEQGELLVLGEKGEAVRVKADPAKHQELFRFQALDDKTWNHPIIAHGKLYVRNAAEMACYDLSP